MSALAVLTLGVHGCARREPPSGGPPDIEPPRLVDSVPDSGAARVPLDQSFSLTFSESMEPRSTNEALAFAPRIEIRQTRWRRRTVTITLTERLRPHQTYTLFVGGGARDRHGNPMGTGAAVVFTTADSFPRGRIEGEIQARGFSAPGTYLWCYDAAQGRTPDSTARDFDALGLVDRLGQFRVDGLAVPGRYRLWAFADLNANRSFDPGSDVLAPIDTTFELTLTRPVARDVKLRVVNPRAPGSVRGVVVDSLTDSLGVVRVLAVSGTDSTRVLSVDAGSEGQFAIDLEPGPWLLRAYRDVDRSKTWQPDRERASAPLPLQVAPAADIVELKLAIRKTIGGP